MNDAVLPLLAGVPLGIAGLVAMAPRGARWVLPLTFATLIASFAVAVVLVRRWLEGFAYHAPFSPLVLVGAAVAALVLALASVGMQALRTARRDPIRALRSE